MSHVSDYRREFSANDKKYDNNDDDDDASKQLLESVTNFDSPASFHERKANAHYIPNFDLANSTAVSATTSLTNSPFIDKKSDLKKPLIASALALNCQVDSPRLKAKGKSKAMTSSMALPQLSPGSPSEHQYDIPFSHLNPSRALTFGSSNNNNSNSSRSSQDVDDQQSKTPKHSRKVSFIYTRLVSGCSSTLETRVSCMSEGSKRVLRSCHKMLMPVCQV